MVLFFDTRAPVQILLRGTRRARRSVRSYALVAALEVARGLCERELPPFIVHAGQISDKLRGLRASQHYLELSVRAVPVHEDRAVLRDPVRESFPGHRLWASRLRERVPHGGQHFPGYEMVGALAHGSVRVARAADNDHVGQAQVYQLAETPGAFFGRADDAETPEKVLGDGLRLGGVLEPMVVVVVAARNLPDDAGIRTGERGPHVP